MALLTRRAVVSCSSSNSNSWAAKAKAKDDSCLDLDLETGVAPSSTSTQARTSSKSKLSSSDGDVLCVVQKPSTKTCLAYMLTWGLMLYIVGGPVMRNWISQQQQQQPASTKWLFKKPPTLREMYDLRNCESYLATYDEDGKRIDSKSLPIYTDEQWAYFRKIWSAQGGKDMKYKKHDIRRSLAPPDLVPPFKAGQTKDGKGRGVFATRDIKKGEMTYGGSKHYIFFTTGHDYRRFLDALDDETACDLMKFTWPDGNIGTKGEAVIMGVMDDNAFMNDGGKERANTGCPPDEYCGVVREAADESGICGIDSLRFLFIACLGCNFHLCLCSDTYYFTFILLLPFSTV